jgi:hypothetical protein
MYERFFTRSLLYQEFVARNEEILKHKWIESEKVGHDIGFDRALVDWLIKHRRSWSRNRCAQLQRFRVTARERP